MQLSALKFPNKQFKGQGIGLGDLPQVVIIFVVIAIVIGMGALVLTGMQNQTAAGSTASNVLTKGLEGMTTFSNWQPTLAIAVIAAVILVIIVGLFASRRSGGGL